MTSGRPEEIDLKAVMMTSRIGEQRNRGFTLIELLLVAMILVALVGISTPRFRKTYANLELKDTGNTLSRFINFAQQRAILEERVFKLVFDYEGKLYWIMETSDPDAGETGSEFVRVRGRFSKKLRIPRDISIKGDREEIFFYPDGHSEKMRIELENKNGNTLKIISTGYMGNVDIEEAKGR